jgi:hypothetical protein
VAQLILSTTQQHMGDYVSTSGLPSIVSDANIQLLFDMQELVDNVTGEKALVTVSDGLLRTATGVVGLSWGGASPFLATVL